MRHLRLKTEKGVESVVIILSGICVTAAMLFAYIGRPTLLTHLDFKVYDLLLPLRAAPEPSPAPVIVDLDEAAIEQYGQWPWPRYLIADILERLTDYGAAAIGLDIMFAEADRSSPERVQEALRRDKSLDFKYSGIPPEFRDYDLILADALQKNQAVLSAYADFTGESSEAPPPPSVNIIEREKSGAIPSWREIMPEAKSAVLPLPVLRGAPMGFINARQDTDGIVREIPLVIRMGENIYPSLSVRVLMQGLGQRNLTLESGPHGLESVRLGKLYSVPVSPQGMMRIPFIGPRRTYPYYSAADVLAARVPPEALQGRAVFVGTSLVGLSDIRSTPFDAACPGVEVHAAALDAILSGNAVSLPPWTPAAQVGLIALAGLLSTLTFGFARPRVYLPVALALVGAAIQLSRYLFSRGLFLSPLYGVLTVAALGAILLLARFWQEERQKRRLRGIFSRYVSPEVVNRVTRTAGELMAGEERELSIMFTDIRGFTSMSEMLKPQEVVSLLNRYFTPMTALVSKYSGTLDKFIGDALMAYWNAPLDVPEHPVKAVETALCMQETLPSLNERLRTDMNLEVHIGVGVHTGRAFVGNMGTDNFVNYTLIGDNVNLASRLEGLCPRYGVGIIISEETRDACGDAFAFQSLDILQVKGRIQPVAVYLPLRREEAEKRREELTAWEDAWKRYAAGDFAASAAMLDPLFKAFPETKLYAIFADRLSHLLAQPPLSWNGIWSGTRG